MTTTIKSFSQLARDTFSRLQRLDDVVQKLEDFLNNSGACMHVTVEGSNGCLGLVRVNKKGSWGLAMIPEDEDEPCVPWKNLGSREKADLSPLIIPLVEKLHSDLCELLELAEKAEAEVVACMEEVFGAIGL